MNYIHQLNGFRRWRGQHALSPFAQLLWYSLTVEQNHRLWPERFSISSNDLRQIIGGVGPAEFYAKIVGATIIEDSTPGMYRGLLPL